MITCIKAGKPNDKVFQMLCAIPKCPYLCAAKCSGIFWMAPDNLALYESLILHIAPFLPHLLGKHFFVGALFNKEIRYKSATPMKLNSQW